jgi:hypothetical protein
LELAVVLFNHNHRIRLIAFESVDESMLQGILDLHDAVHLVCPSW